MCDLLTTLYIVSYNPCKHPICITQVFTQQKKTQFFFTMETKMCDHSNKPYVGGGIFSMSRIRLGMKFWGFCRINENHTYYYQNCKLISHEVLNIGSQHRSRKLNF